jgi:NTE family protein
VQANQFMELLQNWTSHLQSDIDFDKLPIRFRAVATDLENGQMVVFSKGPLHTAIRASMAAPGVFAPIQVNCRLLTDGGLVRNLPVDIARDMGADIVIAVNIGTPLLPRDQLQTLFNISQQMVNILTEQNVQQQKSSLGKNDILIEPSLGSITFMDFGRAAEASLIGQKAALAIKDKLLALALPPHLYLARQQQRMHPELPEIKIGFVEVVTDGGVPEADIRRQLNIKVGSKYDAEDINRKIAALNNSREYDSINHELIERDGVYGVRVNANGRNWGPHFLRFGLALSSGFDGTGNYSLQIGHRRPWLTPGGLEWRNDLELGNTMRLHTELRQPLFEREGIFLSPYAEAADTLRNLYQDDTLLAEYSLRSQQVGVDLGMPLGENRSLGEARLGISANRYLVHPKIGGILRVDANNQATIIPLPSVDLRQVGLKTSLLIDRLDAPSFPREGYKLDTQLYYGLEQLRGKYKQVDITAMWAKSINNHSINLKFMGSGLFVENGDALGLGGTLGGFQRLSAYPQDQFSGNYMLYGSATYLLRALNSELAGNALFFGSSLELGNTWDTRKDISLPSLRKSLSLFAGFNSFLGPVYLGVAQGQGGNKNVFFQLGRQ